MIHLDQRFNDFFDEYKYQQDRANPLPGDKAEVRQPVVIKPLDDEPNEKSILNWYADKQSRQFIYSLYSVGGLAAITAIVLIMLTVTTS